MVIDRTQQPGLWYRHLEERLRHLTVEPHLFPLEWTTWLLLDFAFRDVILVLHLWPFYNANHKYFYFLSTSLAGKNAGNSWHYMYGADGSA